MQYGFFMSKKLEQNNFYSEKQFEAKQNLTGFFRLLLEIDIKNNPQLYENNRNTNNTNQGE